VIRIGSKYWPQEIRSEFAQVAPGFLPPLRRKVRMGGTGRVRCGSPPPWSSPNSVRHEICQRGDLPVQCHTMKKNQGRLRKGKENAAGGPAALVVQGFKYVRLVGTLLQALHNAGAERDRAGNRQLFYDQYATLLLLYFFTPTVTSLRGVQQLSLLARVQQGCGRRRTAFGSISWYVALFESEM